MDRHGGFFFGPTVRSRSRWWRRPESQSGRTSARPEPPVAAAIDMQQTFLATAAAPRAVCGVLRVCGPRFHQSGALQGQT